MQEENADSLILSTFGGSIISFILVQWQNANIPISTTVSGIENETTLEHPKNASFLIIINFEGSTNDGMLLQLKKADSSNIFIF
jgi:hypothetical protein